MVEKSIRLTLHTNGDGLNGLHPAHRFSNIEPIGSRDAKGFVFSHRVLPNDVDQFKHMSFANYIKLMFDAADTLFLKMLGDGFQDRFKTQLKYATVQFKQQTRTGDLIFIIPQVSKADNIVTIEAKYVIDLGMPTEEEVACGEMVYQLESLDRTSILSPGQFLEALASNAGLKFLIASEVPQEKRLFMAQKAQNVYIYDKIKVFFKHTDYHGGLQPYHFFEWTSHIREAFLSDKCADLDGVLRSSIAMMTSKIELEILGESRFSDEIEAHLTATKVKKVSCDLVMNFYNKRLKEYVATTRHTLVFADPIGNRFAPIPDSLRPAMIEFSEP
jgi:acyl-CoA thioesterase FadM